MDSNQSWNGHVNDLRLVLTLIEDARLALGNLNWMYESIHNAEQMLPHLEPIDLPEPLRDMTSMNVICYDFVPQLLSILQNKKMMAGHNLVLDPNNPLARYKPSDDRLGEALSGSVYQGLTG